jgi:hypothetical protein
LKGDIFSSEDRFMRYEIELEGIIDYDVYDSWWGVQLDY